MKIADIVRTSLLAGFVFVSHSAFAAGNMLKNPGFEHGFENWRKPSSMWRVEDGSGYGGTKGLVWESVTPGLREYPAQYVKLEPGCAYRFSALVKVDELQKGVNPAIGFEWFDTNGKWAAGAYAHPVDDNGILKGGWVLYEGKTRMMKESDARGGLLCMLKAGSTGKVRFDDFKFERVQVKPIEFLCTSAYRDSAADGMLRVFASVNAQTNRHAASLSVRTVGGGAKEFAPLSFSGDAVEFSVPVADLAEGTQRMRFSLKAREDGSVIAEEEIAFTRTGEDPKRRRVAFDAQGRMLLDGKRFFPLGHYTGYMSDADMEQYRRGPYNFAVQYAGINRGQLDRWQKAGVYVASDVRGYIYGYSYPTRCGIKALEDTKAALKKRYDDIGSHPALVMWYLNDEAPVGLVRNTSEVHEFLHSLDPERATLACLCDPKTSRNFLPSYDVIAHDCYPIGNHVGRSMTERITRQMQVVKDGMRSMRPLWFVPQTFDWRWHYSKEVWPKCDRQYLRMPTRQEMANMTWQGIACGANGIVFYSYSSIRKNTKGEEFEKAWGDTCDVAFEVKKMEETLLADDVTGFFAAACAKLPSYMPVRFYRNGGKVWMLLVNATREARKGMVSLGSPCRELDTVLGGGVTVSADGCTLDVDLPPLGYAFVSFCGQANDSDACQRR